MRIAFVGGGNMARAILGGLIAKGTSPGDVVVVEIDAGVRERIRSEYGVEALEAAGPELAGVDAAILAVKPQQMRTALAPVASWAGEPLYVSIAAGIRVEDIARCTSDH